MGLVEDLTAKLNAEGINQFGTTVGTGLSSRVYDHQSRIAPTILVFVPDQEVIFDQFVKYSCFGRTYRDDQELPDFSEKGFVPSGSYTADIADGKLSKLLESSQDVFAVAVALHDRRADFYLMSMPSQTVSHPESSPLAQQPPA